MKLYTESELRKHLYNHSDEFFEQLTPIELPSDEEIKKEMGYDAFDPYDIAYYGGIDYMRSKIQGGNK